MARFNRAFFAGRSCPVRLRCLPKVAIPALVNSLKGVSSRRLRQIRLELVRRYWEGVLWSPSYFAASSGGAPIGIGRQYIEQQRMPD